MLLLRPQFLALSFAFFVVTNCLFHPIKVNHLSPGLVMWYSSGWSKFIEIRFTKPCIGCYFIQGKSFLLPIRYNNGFQAVKPFNNFCHYLNDLKMKNGMAPFNYKSIDNVKMRRNWKQHQKGEYIKNVTYWLLVK